MRKFNKGDILEMDFRAYVASSSDEEDDDEEQDLVDEEKHIEKYKVWEVCREPILIL